MQVTTVGSFIGAPLHGSATVGHTVAKTITKETGGKGMFRKYTGMTMVERDTIVKEWYATLALPH